MQVQVPIQKAGVDMHPDKLGPSEPFRLWVLPSGGYTVDDWYIRVGKKVTDLGLYTAKQIKDTFYLYQGIWTDHNSVVFPWCMNCHSGHVERCRIVKRNHRLKMVTSYGEDVALLVPYNDDDSVLALAQLREASAVV